MLITFLKTTAIAVATVVGLTGAITETTDNIATHGSNLQQHEPVGVVTVSLLEGDLPDLMVTASRAGDPDTTSALVQ